MLVCKCHLRLMILSNDNKQHLSALNESKLIASSIQSSFEETDKEDFKIQASLNVSEEVGKHLLF